MSDAGPSGIVYPNFVGEELNHQDLQTFLHEHGIINFTAAEIAKRTLPPLWLWSRCVPVLQLLQRVRSNVRLTHPQFHIPVDSGYRDPEHNAAIGGTDGSRHMYFEAMDIRPMISQKKQMTGTEFMTFVKKDSMFPFLWWKDYKTFLHFDMRSLFTFRPEGKNFK